MTYLNYFFFDFDFDLLFFATFLTVFLDAILQQESPFLQPSIKPKDLPNLQIKQLQHPPCDINFYCPSIIKNE